MRILLETIAIVGFATASAIAKSRPLKKDSARAMRSRAAPLRRQDCRPRACAAGVAGLRPVHAVSAPPRNRAFRASVARGIGG